MKTKSPPKPKPPGHGRAGRMASPWNRGPMCDTPNAKKSFNRYQRSGKK